MAEIQSEYKCIVKYSKEWEQRVADAFVDLYYRRLAEGFIENRPESADHKRNSPDFAENGCQKMESRN